MNTLSINSLVLETFENFLRQNFWLQIWIQHPKFSLIANSYIPRVCDFDFMAIINLKIYKGFGV